jgi:hypothetical protein
MATNGAEATHRFRITTFHCIDVCEHTRSICLEPFGFGSNVIMSAADTRLNEDRTESIKAQRGFSRRPNTEIRPHDESQIDTSTVACAESKQSIPEQTLASKVEAEPFAK